MCDFCKEEGSFILLSKYPAFGQELFAGVCITTNGELSLSVDFGGEEFLLERVKIKYCPMCGRKI